MCPGYQVSKQALTKTTLSLFIPPTDDSWARSGSPTAPGIPTMEIFLPNFDPRTPHADFDLTYSIARSSTFLLRGARDKNAN